MDQFEQLHKKYREDIYKYLYYLSGDPYIAEDLTQDTFLGAFKSIHQFKGKSKVSTWLFQIAKYTFYDYLRNKKQRSKMVEDIKEKTDGAIEHSPEMLYSQKEETAQLLNALKKLKQPQQHIVILRIYNELSYKEIGEIFNQSENWARVNFYRGKNKLGSIIERGDISEQEL